MQTRFTDKSVYRGVFGLSNWLAHITIRNKRFHLFTLALIIIFLLSPVQDAQAIGVAFTDYAVDADSTVDPVANIGDDGATSFSDAQTKDGSNQTITEASSSIEDKTLEDYVDNDSSDIDSSPDQGTLTNFANMQDIDLVDGSFSESASAGTIEKQGTDTSTSSNTLTGLSWSHTLVAGSSRAVIVMVAWENGNINTAVSGITYGGNSLTAASSQASGNTGSGFENACQIWYILEVDLPANGPQTVAVTMTGTASSLENNAIAIQVQGVDQGGGV
ncbi:MAG: hypothetical protein ACXAB7_05830, partial [Candidatus Kariarchaeaceae archaeon]